MAKVVRTYFNKKQTKLKEEYYEVNKRKEGIYKSYFENGNIDIICNYINGKKNGEYKLYYSNGQFTF